LAASTLGKPDKNLILLSALIYLVKTWAHVFFLLSPRIHSIPFKSFSSSEKFAVTVEQSSIRFHNVPSALWRHETLTEPPGEPYLTKLRCTLERGSELIGT